MSSSIERTSRSGWVRTMEPTAKLPRPNSLATKTSRARRTERPRCRMPSWAATIRMSPFCSRPSSWNIFTVFWFGLLRDPLDLVALGIRVARLHFLVGELVGHRELLDDGNEASLELVTFLDELPDAVLVEETLGDCAIHGVFRESPDLFLLSVCDGGDQCFHCHPPSILDLPESLWRTAFLCMR